MSKETCALLRSPCAHASKSCSSSVCCSAPAAHRPERRSGVTPSFGELSRAHRERESCRGRYTRTYTRGTVMVVPAHTRKHSHKYTHTYTHTHTHTHTYTRHSSGARRGDACLSDLPASSKTHKKGERISERTSSRGALTKYPKIRPERDEREREREREKFIDNETDDLNIEVQLEGLRRGATTQHCVRKCFSSFRLAAKVQSGGVNGQAQNKNKIQNIKKKNTKYKSSERGSPKHNIET